jgi:hypothetical protein
MADSASDFQRGTRRGLELIDVMRIAHSETGRQSFTLVACSFCFVSLAKVGRVV